MSEENKFEGMFFTKPTPTSRIYHIFGKNRRALCGKWGMLFVNPNKCTEVKGTETFGEEDCKACFRKAGLLKEAAGHAGPPARGGR